MSEVGAREHSEHAPQKVRAPQAPPGLVDAPWGLAQ